MKRKYITLINTEMEGLVPGLWTEENGIRKPYLFDTFEDAWREIISNYVEELEQFLRGERPIDETNVSGPDEWVEECAIYPNGVLALEDGFVIFDPNK